MRVLTRQTVLFVVLILCAPLTDLKSQIPTDKKTATASVGGNVTIKGKGAAGITVVLRLANSSDPNTGNYRAKTDQDGNYRISNLAAGSYEVNPDAGAFVVSAGSGNGILIISEGESVDGIDFSLTKGAVITGRITNSEGQPVVEQPVGLMSIESSQNFGIQRRGNAQSSQTDDRGVYRIFGLAPGKYMVSVAGGRRGAIRQTFYPGVSDSAKATIVEVSEGSETKNIDIKVETNDSSEKFSVTGRVVDGVSGQPIPNVRIGLSRMSSSYPGSDAGSSSDKEGQFKIERLAVGHYGIYVYPSAGNEVSADPVSFEIVDRDVDGVMIKTYKGGSVSGRVIFEGDDKSTRSSLNQFMLEVYVQTPTGSSGRTVRLAPDKTFRMGGLKEGSLSFRAFSNSGGSTTGLTVARIARNGVVETRSIEIKDGEQVEGLKIFVTVGTGTIRGTIKGNGELPPTAQISVWFSQAGADTTRVQPQSVLVDSRGHFVAEGLAAGTYEVNVSVFVPGANRRVPSAKQQVTVSDGNVTEVTIPVDLSPGP